MAASYSYLRTGRQKPKKKPSFRYAFFSIFGGGAQHAAKNRKKCKIFVTHFFDFWRRYAAKNRKTCKVFVSHFFRFLAAVRSTPPKIEKNAKFSFVRPSVRSSVRPRRHCFVPEQLLPSTEYVRDPPGGGKRGGGVYITSLASHHKFRFCFPFPYSSPLQCCENVA